MHRPFPIRAAAICLALAAVCTAVLAQDEEPPRQTLRQRLLKRLDKDGDGRLSAAERRGLRDLLRRRDAEQPAEPAEPTVDPARTPLYKLGSGPWQVQSEAQLVLRDEQRDKELPLRVTFPQRKREAVGPPADSPAKHPLIVFSHGAAGSKDGYQPLVSYWASHGYVCIQPTHGDSLSLLSPELRGEFRSLDEYVNSAEALQYWRSRPEDIRLVLDSLDKIAAQIPALRGRLDAGRIGMGGHSFGAHTTQMIGGLSLKRPLGAERLVIADPRPRALLMISPQGSGRGIDEDSWGEILRPTMVVTGSNDTSRTGQPYTWRMEVFERLPAKDKFLAFVEGAHHNFGGISGAAAYPGAGPANADHVYYVKTATLAFWDAYLKSDSAARLFLESDRLEKVSGGAAYLRRKAE